MNRFAGIQGVHQNLNEGYQGQRLHAWVLETWPSASAVGHGSGMCRGARYGSYAVLDAKPRWLEPGHGPYTTRDNEARRESSGKPYQIAHPVFDPARHAPLLRGMAFDTSKRFTLLACNRSHVKS